MGLTGVTLEAASVSSWADRASSMEATRAAGTLFWRIPDSWAWMSLLDALKPAEVRAVLMAEILDEITRTEPVHRETLERGTCR